MQYLLSCLEINLLGDDAWRFWWFSTSLFWWFSTSFLMILDLFFWWFSTSLFWWFSTSLFWFSTSFYDSQPLFLFSTSFYDSRPLFMIFDLFFYSRPLFLVSLFYFRGCIFLLDGSGSRYKHFYSVIKLKKIVFGQPIIRSTTLPKTYR